jgi:hypothetical protein
MTSDSTTQEQTPAGSREFLKLLARAPKFTAAFAIAFILLFFFWPPPLQLVKEGVSSGFILGVLLTLVFSRSDLRTKNWIRLFPFGLVYVMALLNGTFRTVPAPYMAEVPNWYWEMLRFIRPTQAFCLVFAITFAILWNQRRPLMRLIESTPVS